MKGTLRLLCALSLVFAVIGLPLLANAEKIKIGSIAPPKNGHTLSLIKIADEVREQTGGRLDIQVFPLGQLGNERSMCAQVQAGTLQMVSSTTSVLSNFVPEVSVIDLPFMFPDIDTAHAVLDDPEVKAKLFSYFEKKGLKALSISEDSLRQMWNTKRPIRKPEDFKGLKIRTMNSPMMLEIFKAFGASPVGIPFPEVYSALQTGVVDGVNASYVASTMMKFPEVAKYLTVSEFHMNTAINTANIDWWKSLSAEDQKLLQDAFTRATQINREMNDKVAAHLPPDGKKSVADYLKEQNVQIATLTAEEREAFKQAAAPVWEETRKKIDNEMIDLMIAKVKEHQK